MKTAIKFFGLSVSFFLSSLMMVHSKGFLSISFESMFEVSATNSL